MSVADFDVIVIGGGIAGVSAAYALSPTHRVCVVEAEETLAQHSTGRSAALLFDNYGSAATRPLTKASRPFFAEPPPELTDAPLLTSRGALWIARADQMDDLEQIRRDGAAFGSPSELLTPDQAHEMVPVLRSELLVAALYEPDPTDIDVAAAHQAYVRGLRANGATIFTSARVSGLTRAAGRWTVEAGHHRLIAPALVNAAGAWGDNVARLAGVDPVGLTPMRRTAFMVIGDEAWSRWPFVVDAEHEFYFKPDGPQLLCSPADETPVEAGDARPDSLDVAWAIEKINEATTLGIRSVRSEWAGLRTFAPDREMVIGPDPSAPGFFWLVGQGGTGIQTAPGAADLVAALVREEPISAKLAATGLDPARLAVDRLR